MYFQYYSPDYDSQTQYYGWVRINFDCLVGSYPQESIFPIQIKYYKLQNLSGSVLIMQISSLAFLVAILHLSQAIECPASHFDFIGRYTLGKQDEVNRTFIKIQQKVTSLQASTFNASQTTSFTIFNAKPVFYYRDSNQKSDILGDDIIVIYGGKLQVALTFQWTKKSLITINGTGSAIGTSDMITFGKKAIVENGSFYSYELLGYQNITWTAVQAFKLQRVQPPTTTDNDKESLTQLLNTIKGVKTVSNVLSEEIDKIYSYYLRASLHDEHMPINDNFDYIWVPGGNKQNVTISFSRRAISIDLEKSGVYLNFDVQVANYSGWKCGNRSIPILPLNPKVFGEAQQFISYDFYQNTIRYAIYKGLLDSELNRENWGSRMFQFFAGDLYQVFSKIQDKFYAADIVLGNCKATDSGLRVKMNQADTFNVSIMFDCQLSIQRNKITDFSLGLWFQVQGVPNSNTLDFKFRSHQQFITFYPYGEYRIIQEDLAKAMVKNCLNRLYEGNLFGSGWPMSPPRDYPVFKTEQNYTIVYDPSQIGLALDEL